MSKLALALAATSTDQRVALPKRFSITETFEPNNKFGGTGTLYSVGARFKSQVIIADDFRPSAEHMARKVEHAKRLIIEEVFGEYRAPIQEALDAIYNYDFERAAAILRAIEDNFVKPEVME